RIEEAARGEALEGRGVAWQVLRLAQHRLGPGEAEPGEIAEDRRLEGRTAARPGDVLDAEHEAPAPRRGESGGGQRRGGVAEVQEPGRRGREAGAQPSRRGARSCAGSVAPRRTGRSGSRRAG